MVQCERWIILNPTFSKGNQTMRQTIYREYACGLWEFWTYSDGERVTLSPTYAIHQMQRNRARIVTIRP